MRNFSNLVCLVAALIIFPFSITAKTKNSALTFCCIPENDLFIAVSKTKKYPRFSMPVEAIERANENSAVLILADKYPAERIKLEPNVLAAAAKKNLRLYVEFPETLPGFEFGAMRQTVWERGVVASDEFGSALPKMRIIAIHDCHFLPVKAANPMLVVSRVAGYDTAVYGLAKESFPILFEVPEKKWIVATTKLSGFVAGRFAPKKDWQTIWETILTKLDPTTVHHLEWNEAVTPAFTAKEKLPRHFEQKAFKAAAGWIVNSRLLVVPSRKAEIEKSLRANTETILLPDSNMPRGDGSLGILEGYASGILRDGTQLQRLPLRADCHAESAMVLGLDALLNGNRASAKIAGNLLDFVYFNSGMCAGVRADPKNSAFGLIGWGDISPAWLVANYGDDNARVLLGTMLAAAALKTDKWDEALAKGLLANFRTTGKLGFRGDRIDIPSLQQNSWKVYRDASPVNYSPHFESYLWACNLWAYRQTNYRPFLDQTKNAIAMTMKVFPQGWRWNDSNERSRMLLCLAWLVRVEGTPEHRQWLSTVAQDLLKRQEPNGAIRELLGGTGGGHLQIPQSNESYGTGETPLIQKNGDPASDQLYTTGFALLGLHEAVGATGDKDLKEAEDKLAEFLCRIQIRSEKHPWLNGTWFRAFDDQRWEFWASSADIGWGAWSIEAGWGQSWTAAVLGLRQRDTTFWQITKSGTVATQFQKWKAIMLEEK